MVGPVRVLVVSSTQSPPLFYALLVFPRPLPIVNALAPSQFNLQLNSFVYGMLRPLHTMVVIRDQFFLASQDKHLTVRFAPCHQSSSL